MTNTYMKIYCNEKWVKSRICSDKERPDSSHYDLINTQIFVLALGEDEFSETLMEIVF